MKIVNQDKYNVIVGENVTITCQAEGFPQPDYIIFHNGTSLTNVVKGMTTIKSVNYSDDGEYKCIANNSLGDVSASFDFIVQGKIFLNTHHCVTVCPFIKTQFNKIVLTYFRFGSSCSIRQNYLIL